MPRQVPFTGEYSGYDAFQGEATYPRTRAGHEGAYSQVPPLPGLQLGIGYGTPLGPPPIPRSPRPPVYQTDPVQPDYAARFPYPSDVAAIATSSQYQGPAVAQDALGGPYYEQRYPKFKYRFFQQHLIDEQQDFELLRLLTCQRSYAYVHSLAHPRVVISIDSFTPTELPAQPQRFDLTDEHYLPPEMQDTLHCFVSRGRRSPLPAFDPQYPVQPANAPNPPYAYQQYPDPMIASGSQYGSPAVVRDTLGGPYYQSWYLNFPFLVAVSNLRMTGRQANTFSRRLQQAYSRVCILPHSSLSHISICSFTKTEPPVPPQGFDVNNGHYLPPPIIVQQPPSQRRGRRRALVVSGGNFWKRANFHEYRRDLDWDKLHVAFKLRPSLEALR